MIDRLSELPDEARKAARSYWFDLLTNADPGVYKLGSEELAEVVIRHFPHLEECPPDELRNVERVLASSFFDIIGIGKPSRRKDSYQRAIREFVEQETAVRKVDENPE